MRERLLQLIETLGLNQKEFCDSTGISQSRLSEVMSGRTLHLSAEALIEISRKHNVNINWLLAGEGEIFSPVTPLSGKTPKEKIRAIEEMRRLRQIIPLDIAEAAKNNPELLELIRLVSKIPADKYQQIKRILKSFLL